MTGVESRIFEWVIVGAGIHGCHIAICLRASGIPGEDLLLLDRFPSPMAQWSKSTARTGMRSLRSPAVHGLDVSPYALFDCADRLPHGGPSPFNPPYERPDYTYFQAHCQQLVDMHGLSDRLLAREALRLEAQDDHYVLSTKGPEVRAHRVVLAVGQPPPCRPLWAQDRARIRHVFDPDWSGAPQSHHVVVGGGLTAAQVALSLSQQSSVTILHRHPWRVHQFDADPCWMGPKCYNATYLEASPQARREMISQARHRGSITPETWEELERAVQAGTVRCLQTEVERVTDTRLKLSDGSWLPYSQVTLATGFALRRPGGDLVDRLVASLDLPVGPCGFPLLTPDLQWRERLYVSGGLAELSLGPVARNISGAREAALRILGPLHPRGERRRRRVGVAS